jgi:hydrogenase nickel incorporation protein HypA/HybF
MECALMHEYSLVQALVDRVAAEVKQRRALAVHKLTIRIGELSGVEPELFRTAYETFREGTVCARATLVLEQVAASWSCPRCSGKIARGAALHCAACDLPARLDEGGDALMLNGMEVD